MKIIIDRLEGNYAVCESNKKEIIKLDRTIIPADAKEGDVLIMKGGIFILDSSETTRRRTKIEELMNDVWE